jgi:hypothetical protein
MALWAAKVSEGAPRPPSFRSARNFTSAGNTGILVAGDPSNRVSSTERLPLLRGSRGSFYLDLGRARQRRRTLRGTCGPERSDFGNSTQNLYAGTMRNMGVTVLSPIIRAVMAPFAFLGVPIR